MSLTKCRKIAVEGIAGSACEQRIEAALLSMQGVDNARADHVKGLVHLQYDLLQCTLREIEQTLARLDYKLSGGILMRLKRGFTHDSEANERANHLAVPVACCSKRAEQIASGARRGSRAG